MNSSARRRRPFSARLLIELIRQREEAAGHPEESQVADFAAIQAGGDLLDRIDVRARGLPSAKGLAAAIRGVIRSASLLGALAVALAIVGGILAATRSLEATRPANLPLTLCVLVGLNAVTLLLWLLVQPFSHRIVGLGGSLRTLLQWLVEHPLSQRIAQWIGGSRQHRIPDADRSAGSGVSAAEVLGVIVADGRGRWLFGMAVHTLWLCFALTSSLSLAVLLSLRSYDLSWQTTLLTPGQLAALAHTLSFFPAKLGLVRIDTLSVTATTSALARQSWSSWLVWATLIYGALPRATALCVCLALFWRSSKAIGGDLSRPGFARLRARLMPDTAELAIADPDTVDRRQPADVKPAEFAPLLGLVHGIGLDGAGSDGAPPLPGVQWIWLGQVDDLSSLAVAVSRLASEQVATLAIAVRATMTPDRGVEHLVTELAKTTRAPTVLILQDLDRLEARGTDQARARVACWRALAMGVTTRDLLSWNGSPVSVLEGLPS